MPRFSLGSEAVESEELFLGTSSLELIGVGVLEKVIPSVYSVLPVVENGDRDGPKSWDWERDGERSSVRNRDNDPQQRRIASFIYNVEWKYSDAIMGFNQIC